MATPRVTVSRPSREVRALYDLECPLRDGIVLGASKPSGAWQTGRLLGQDAEFQVARQTVYHDREHPSQILLPAVP